MQIANRESFAVASRKRLPYDAEVEWVKGSTYALTDYYPSDRTTFVHSCQTDSLSFVPFCGMPWISEAQNFLCSAANNNQRLYLDYGSGFGYNRIVLGPSNTWWQNRRLRLEAGNRYVRDTISGYGKTAASVSFARKTTPWRVYIYARFFAHQLYDDGALILDLVPVRKDGVAYLYNKADNRLLPLTGSSVVIGPDKTPWTNPYVTDGLVAMWDGEWNAGPGVHDASATTWADICGRTPLSFETPAAITVMPNAMRVDYSFPNNSARVLSGQVGFAETAQTVEVCVTVDSGFTLNQDIFMGPYSANGANTFCVIALNGNRGFIFNDGAMYGLNTSATVSATIAWTGSTAYKNAVALEAYGSNRTAFVRDGYICIGSGSQQKYNIHSLRLYSRALTAAEIAANYAIDKERFGLP